MGNLIIIFFTKIGSPENLPQYSGQVIIIRLLDQITSAQIAVVPLLPVHHVIGLSLFALGKVVKIQISRLWTELQKYLITAIAMFNTESLAFHYTHV